MSPTWTAYRKVCFPVPMPIKIVDSFSHWKKTVKRFTILSVWRWSLKDESKDNIAIQIFRSLSWLYVGGNKKSLSFNPDMRTHNTEAMGRKGLSWQGHWWNVTQPPCPQNTSRLSYKAAKNTIKLNLQAHGCQMPVELSVFSLISWKMPNDLYAGCQIKGDNMGPPTALIWY